MASEQVVAWSRPLFFVGIGLSSFASGTISSISLITIPVVFSQTNNAALLTSWRRALFTGGSVSIPLALSASLVHAVNAYINLHSSPENTRSKYLAAAALITAAIVPYTFILIIPTNTELLKQEELARGTVKEIEAGASSLIKKWASLNFVRSFLPALGALAAFMAL